MALLLPLHLAAQKQNNVWLFGSGTGIDFNGAGPVCINGSLTSLEGCASIANRTTGVLLFYTNGEQVWNALHAAMPGGPLHGSFSSTQSALIIPMPGDSLQYYIFTTDAKENGLVNGLQYSIVDMRLDGGHGAITTANVPLLAPATEKVTAIADCGGRGYWVLAHGWLDDKFYAYPITPAGVGAPVITSIGLVHSPPTLDNCVGYMRASPDGRRVAVAIRDLQTVQLFDFDASTGVFSNPITLKSPIANCQSYGVAFSPDNTKLYVSEYYGGVFQYTVTSRSQAVVAQTRVELWRYISESHPGALLLAPDGKIYCAMQDLPSLSVINTPNATGTGANFVASGFTLTTGASRIGLPNLIAVSPPPVTTLKAGPGGTICPGDSIVLTASAAVSYHWTPSAGLSCIDCPSPHASPSASTTYTVTFLSASGCFGASDSVRVVVQPAPNPTVSVLGKTTICEDDSVKLTTLERFDTYSWSNGDTARTTVVHAGGTYSVSVTAGGCTGRSQPVVIQVAPRPKPDIIAQGPLERCAGDSITLTATDGFSDYNWSNGARSRSITLRAPGTYAVAVAVHNAQGCLSVSDTLRAVIHAAPRPTLTSGGRTVICDGDSVVLDAGAGYAAYHWPGGDSTRTIVVKKPGRYTAQIIDSNGCTGTTNALIVTFAPRPTPAIQGAVTACSGSSVTYSTAAIAGHSYAWTVAGGTIRSGAGTAGILVDWNGAGTGTIELVETSAEGCSASAIYRVTIGIELQPVIVPGGPTALCAGITVTLDAGAGYASYLWSTGDTTQRITVSAPGSYHVAVSDPTGCHGTSPDITITEREIKIPAIAASGPLAFCGGDSVVLDAGAGFARYRWSNGDTTQSIVITTSGIFSVTLTDTSGCSGVAGPVGTTVHIPVQPSITRNGDSLFTSPAVAYQWMRGGTLIAGATAPVHAIGPADSVASYTVRVIDSNGCAATSPPFAPGSSERARFIWIDTVRATVGNPLRLTARALPPLETPVLAKGYTMKLRVDPAALYPLGIDAPPFAKATDDNIAMRYDANGSITIERAPGAAGSTGPELFRLELRGLITGNSVNSVAIESMTLNDGHENITYANGVVNLDGCEIGRDAAFSKRSALRSISPMPARDHAGIRYSAPEGAFPRLRAIDIMGREILTTALVTTGGDEHETTIDLRRWPSGIYLLELLDGTERSSALIVVAK